MKISKRLETIANLVPSNSKVIDVGCDHALLDIYLSLEKNCECIATDVNENALGQAKYNISRFHAKNITTVLTDGLEGIELSDTDIIVISGMGTATIRSIVEKKELSNRILISTHTDFEDLRRCMVSLGYKIQDEKYIEEKGKYYIIMDFVKGIVNYSEEDYCFGPILKTNLQYIETEQEKIMEIMKKIPDNDSELLIKKQLWDELEQLKKRI